MEEQTKFAFEFARDTVRQFITLATGIIALTITFSKDFIGSVPEDIRAFALISWVLFLVSILFGLWALMALTGTLGMKVEESTELSIRKRNVTIPAAFQIPSFFLGLVFVIVFGIKAS